MKKRKKLPQSILAEGEVTGHAHRVNVPVYEMETGLREFSGGTDVVHEEHKRLTLPENDWISGRVIEYDHFVQEARTVQD